VDRDQTPISRSGDAGATQRKATVHIHDDSSHKTISFFAVLFPSASQADGSHITLTTTVKYSTPSGMLNGLPSGCYERKHIRTLHGT
jgi:hypothetical protein